MSGPVSLDKMKTAPPNSSCQETKKIRVEGNKDVFGGLPGGSVAGSKRSSSRKQKKLVGGEANITKVPVNSASAQDPEPTPISPPSTAPPAVSKINSNVSSQVDKPLSSEQVGGQTSKPKVKVVLNKPRLSHRAVKLVPKKIVSTPLSTAHKTKKARKITLGVPSLKRRITIAQKIRTKVSSTPIDKLREELINKGLLKAGSKTPEDLIRQIAADAQILSRRGL